MYKTWNQRHVEVATNHRNNAIGTPHGQFREFRVPTEIPHETSQRIRPYVNTVLVTSFECWVMRYLYLPIE